MARPKTRPSYHAEFGRAALKGVGINTGEFPQNWGALELCSLGMGAWLTPRYQ